MSSKPTFLGLPVEIRLRIYRHAISPTSLDICLLDGLRNREVALSDRTASLEVCPREFDGHKYNTHRFDRGHRALYLCMLPLVNKKVHREVTEVLATPQPRKTIYFCGPDCVYKFLNSGQYEELANIKAAVIWGMIELEGWGSVF